MLSSAIVLGGLGQAGTLLSHSLRGSGIAVTLVDSRSPDSSAASGMTFLQSDVAVCGPELKSAIRRSDCVCVCLPEKVTLDAVSALVSAMPDGTLWVDTLSVKTDIAYAMGPQAGRLEVLSINPMFAPALGWTGKPVAAVELSGGPKSAFFQQMLTGWGARVEAVGAEEHDRLTAAIQVATHAAVLSFGATLLALEPDLEKILRLATPPHRLLLILLHRMAMQNPEVYWDIQAYHPLAGAVRQHLRDELERMDSDARKGEVERFSGMFSELKLMFEPSAELFAKWSKEIFT